MTQYFNISNCPSHSNTARCRRFYDVVSEAIIWLVWSPLKSFVGKYSGVVRNKPHFSVRFIFLLEPGSAERFVEVSSPVDLVELLVLVLPQVLAASCLS